MQYLLPLQVHPLVQLHRFLTDVVFAIGGIGLRERTEPRPQVLLPSIIAGVSECSFWKKFSVFSPKITPVTNLFGPRS